MTAPLIAIVGRPNVGKSTLYNRLVGGRPALVHDRPGLTRDRRYGQFDYFGHVLRVVDTGGLDPRADKEVIGAGIHRQARAALDQADAVLFVVDAAAGVTPLDREVASMLRKRGLLVLCCANKIDHSKRDILTADIYALGLGDVFPVSAAHGRGIDEMLEALVEALALPAPQPPAAAPRRGPGSDADPAGANANDNDNNDGANANDNNDGANANDNDDGANDNDDNGASNAAAGNDDAANDAADDDTAADDEADRGPLRVALVGKPNAGKSSLLNRLVGSERALVHHQPGTTTDPVDTRFALAGRDYVLVDTAGIRRKARIDQDVEKIAVSMAISQIERADVVILLIDSGIGATEQDARLAGAVHDRGRALVIALNKIDLLSGPGSGRALEQSTRDALHFMPHVPLVQVSAMRGDGVVEVMEAVDRAAVEHRRRISTAELNRFFADVCETHPPPLYRGRNVRIHYLTQGGVRPPTFLLWANRRDAISQSYRRFLIRRLRDRYGFAGTPVRLVVKTKRRVQLSRSRSSRGRAARRGRRR